MTVKCLAQEHNTMTRLGLEPGPLDSESSTLTTRPLHILLKDLVARRLSGDVFTNTYPIKVQKIFELTASFLCFFLGNLKGSLWASERLVDDIMIRKFVEGVMHGFVKSEVVIKRKANCINIVFLVPPIENLPKFYFLVAFTETLLTEMLECIVKVEAQSSDS